MADFFHGSISIVFTEITCVAGSHSNTVLPLHWPQRINGLIAPKSFQISVALVSKKSFPLQRVPNKIHWLLWLMASKEVSWIGKWQFFFRHHLSFPFRQKGPIKGWKSVRKLHIARNYGKPFQYIESDFLDNFFSLVII